MVASNTAQTDTLADVKDEAKPFNSKLRRVLNDKSAKDLAELLGISVQTVYSWKSRGTQPPAHQLPIVAKFAGCSLDYLCDNSIPLEADPKQGPGHAPLTDGELFDRLRSRYQYEASRCHDYLDEAQGIPWFEVAQRLLSMEVTDKLPHDIARAVEIAEFLPSLMSDKIERFIPVFKADSFPERLRPEGIEKRLKAVTSSRSIAMVSTIIQVRRGMAFAARHPERELDLTGSKRLFDEVRLEVVELEATMLHLIDTFEGVLLAGGLEQYYLGVIHRAKDDLNLKIKKGELQCEERELPEKLVRRCLELIVGDTGRQAGFERKAQSAWCADATVKTASLVLAGREGDKRIDDRMKARIDLLGDGFVEFAKNS